MNEKININWYRCKVDKAVMRELIQRSDARAFLQVALQLAWFGITTALAYLAYRHLNASNWPTALPLLLLALFVHGTFTSFIGAGIACHELCHKTPFASQFWNDFFLRVYSFLGWFDPIGFRASHVRHHQATVHTDHDGEVMQPLGLDWASFRFVLTAFTFRPGALARLLRFWLCAVFGNFKHDAYFTSRWLQRVLPESDIQTRRELRRWARVMVLGHLALAAAFVATGHGFLIVLVNFGGHYCSWLVVLCGGPQHAGLAADATDFRLNTRTYTCGWLPAFFYWNMQYHVEHHMFPAVPFYRLARLRAAIAHDLPPAPHGLWNTWRELRAILARQRVEPGYRHVPRLPGYDGDRSGDNLLPT